MDWYGRRVVGLGGVGLLTVKTLRVHVTDGEYRALAAHAQGGAVPAAAKSLAFCHLGRTAPLSKSPQRKTVRMVVSDEQAALVRSRASDQRETVSTYLRHATCSGLWDLLWQVHDEKDLPRSVIYAGLKE